MCSEITCSYYDETTYLLRCCFFCLRCPNLSNHSLSSAYCHDRDVEALARGLHTNNAWTMCAKSGWRYLGPLARTAIAVTFKRTVIADYMLVLKVLLLGQLFFTLPTQASKYQMMRAASNCRRFRKVHWPAVHGRPLACGCPMRDCGYG
jgi:hypothetical protein